TAGEALGGENQFLIIGVQIGLLPMLIYIFLYGYIIFLTAKYFKNSNEKLKKIALLLLLLKIGLLLPLLTSEAESYLYISYLTWFFTGYFINLTTSSEELKPSNTAN
ncbi:MAG: hypothetical protein ACOVJ8_03965, partial [Sediminibacterium sp.]